MSDQEDLIYSSGEESQQEDFQSQRNFLANTVDECLNKCQEAITINGMPKLIKRIQSEANNLKMIPVDNTTSRHAFRCSNIHLYRFFVDKVTSLNNVVSVLEAFPYKGDRIIVDIIYDNEYHWMKIFSRNPQFLHLSCFGYHDKIKKCALWTAKRYMNLARNNPNNFQIPSVVFFFGNGITKQLKTSLESIGVKVEGDIVELSESTKLRMIVPDDILSSDDGSSSDLSEDFKLGEAFLSERYSHDRVNLDVSTMIALVTELTHGGHIYKFDESNLEIPAALERATRLLPVIHNFLKDKEMVACRTALDEFQEIVTVVGGPNERKRADELLKRVTIVEDQPSERAMALAESARVRNRTKIIFGTGDTLRIITSTSNTSFLRSAAQQGARFAVYVHESYPLTIKRFLQCLNR
ncbi:hypothetical protein GJ496_001130 [Pomphorhynchus laevis]|nr:hypothetical protein GJ496_001130 [Pomphorhynchus laevis]